jgi:hypothetical protein
MEAMTGTAPKVFISHAGEDKPFVIPFATALRENGVDAWVDEWEIRAGDSIVQKIFDEGIKQAAIVIVVLSSTSVTKKWVREELDIAIVNRINKTSRLIPVIIENCEIPSALRSTKWVRYDGNDLKKVVDEILRTVFLASDKPALGPAPSFVRNPLPAISGLDRIDTHVLDAVGALLIKGETPVLSKEMILQELQSLNLHSSQIDESLEILSDSHYITPIHALGTRFAMVKVELPGTAKVLQRRFPDLAARYRQVTAEVVNGNSTNDGIASRLSLPLVVVNYVLDDLAAKGMVKLLKGLEGRSTIFEVSARLRRITGN